MVDVFFCEAKTACVFRISDWSSDGCSSDLNNGVRRQIHHGNGIVSGIGHEGAPAIAVDDDMGRVVTDRNPSERTGSQIVGVEDDEEALHPARAIRSEGSRTGEDGVSTCRSRWWPSQSNNNTPPTTKT